MFPVCVRIPHSDDSTSAKHSAEDETGHAGASTGAEHDGDKKHDKELLLRLIREGGKVYAFMESLVDVARETQKLFPGEKILDEQPEKVRAFVDYLVHKAEEHDPGTSEEQESASSEHDSGASSGHKSDVSEELGEFSSASALADTITGDPGDERSSEGRPFDPKNFFRNPVVRLCSRFSKDVFTEACEARLRWLICWRGPRRYL